MSDLMIGPTSRRRTSTSPQADPRDVLLVPGAWTTAAAFDDVAAELERHGLRVRTIDLPARAARIPQLHRGDLTAIDRALDSAVAEFPTPPIVIGHSLGGLAALRASRRHPLPALVLLMPAPPRGLLSAILPDLVRKPLNTLTILGASLSVRLAGRITNRTPAGLYSRTVAPETLERA